MGWTPRGVAACILSLCIGVSYAAALILTALQRGPSTPEGINLLTTLGGVLVGAVAGWLGATSQTERDRDARRSPPSSSSDDDTP
jgi:hypothetical protein